MTRFTSECDLRVEQLTEFITASNEVVDDKAPIPAPKPPSARQLAAFLIDHALKRRESARQSLSNPKEEHR